MISFDVYAPEPQPGAAPVGRSLKFQIDTGSSRTAIREGAVDFSTLPISRVNQYRGVGAAGNSNMYWSTLKYKPDMPGFTTEIARLPLPGMEGVTDGLLGMDIMRAFELIVDTPSGIVKLNRWK